VEGIRVEVSKTTSVVRSQHP